MVGWARVYRERRSPLKTRNNRATGHEKAGFGMSDRIKPIGEDALLFLACAALLLVFAPLRVRSEAVTIAVETRDSRAIASAVARARPGDEVFLPAGTYELQSSIRLASQTRLRGAGQEQTILRFVGITPDAFMVDGECS